MISENLIQSALRIRRQYIKSSSNIELYHKRAKEIASILDKSIKDLDALKENMDNNKGKDPNKSLSEVVKIIKEVDDEGKRLEELMKPMNEEIEKLQKEENELFRTLKEKYPDASEKDLIKEVAERLRKEGL
jgi:hypothetical protein